jgi:hypothetical protein
MSSIPWRPDEYDCHIRVGDWIANPTPNSSNPLDKVYLVLELTRNKAIVIEFKKTTTNGHIQSTSLQAITITTADYRSIIVLSQEKPGATLKVAREPSAQSKNPLLYWIFDT